MLRILAVKSLDEMIEGREGSIDERSMRRSHGRAQSLKKYRHRGIRYIVLFYTGLQAVYGMDFGVHGRGGFGSERSQQVRDLLVAHLFHILLIIVSRCDFSARERRYATVFMGVAQ